MVSIEHTLWWNANPADTPAPLLEPSTLTPSNDPDYDLRQFGFGADERPRIHPGKTQPHPY
ncbi:MAG: hypothetical protein AAF212_10815 [Verrucomicrobiota bacterium]